MPLRHLADAASSLRLAALAVFHAVALYGLFDRNATALSVARYLSDWMIAEIIALIATPYLMLLTVRNHERALWERLLWLPGMLLVLGGISGSVRFLRATWFYVLSCVPVLWVEHSTAQANFGCARSMVKLFVLIVLMGVFANRPLQWPIGTLAGRWMTGEVRNLANAMACAVAYFAITAVVEFFMRHATSSRPGLAAS